MRGMDRKTETQLKLLLLPLLLGMAVICWGAGYIQGKQERLGAHPVPLPVHPLGVDTSYNSTRTRDAAEQPYTTIETGPAPWPFSNRKIEWLHIPKAGTSFGNTLINWACPELPPGIRVNQKGISKDSLTEECIARLRKSPSQRGIFFGEHVSLVDRTDEELRNVFTMVRSPKTRHVSGYHWAQYTSGKRNPRATEQEICSFVVNTTRAVAARGGQARMVGGDDTLYMGKGTRFYFESSQPPSEALVAEACRRVGLFAFVGVTDHWAASLCLFHAMYGGTVHESELVNVRQGKYAKVEDSLKQARCGDAADEQLFDCSMDVFLERLSQHPHCIKLLSTDNM